MTPQHILIHGIYQRCGSNHLLHLLSQVAGTQRRHQVDVVRYEDLVRDRASVLRALLRRTDLAESEYPWAEIDEQSVRGSSFVGQSYAGQLDWRPAKIADRGFSPIGRWRQWSNRFRQRYERQAGEDLAAWGYCDGIMPVAEALRAFMVVP